MPTEEGKQSYAYANGIFVIFLNIVLRYFWTSLYMEMVESWKPFALYSHYRFKTSM